MRTRIVSIQIDEDQDGRKRTVRKSYPADAMLLMNPGEAGVGFLTIVRDLANALDGVVPQPPPAPAPAPIPDEPAPAPKPGAFAPGQKFSGTRPPPPAPPDPTKAKPGEKGVRFQADPKKPVDNPTPPE